jgi:hypothetical protein
MHKMVFKTLSLSNFSIITAAKAMAVSSKYRGINYYHPAIGVGDTLLDLRQLVYIAKYIRRIQVNEIVCCISIIW